MDKLAEITVKMLIDMIDNNAEASHILLDAEYVRGEIVKERGGL